MQPTLLIVLIALFFYVLIPGIGAFAVRARWRRFRRGVTSASLYPFAGYAHLRGSGDLPEGARIGNFRFLGSLEAIQGDDTIWVKDGHVSLPADMSGVSVYLVPAEAGPYSGDFGAGHAGVVPDRTPTVIRWQKLSSLTEGTRVFLAGALTVKGGKPVFAATDRAPLLVVLYDGDEKRLIHRSIWRGRQRNEYWNQFTPVSLAGGSLALVTAAYVFLHSPPDRVPALMAVSLSVLPLLPFFPPGVIGFFAYRSLWKRGRFLRAERDLVRLPLRYFQSGAAAGDSGSPASRHGVLQRVTRLPDGQSYGELRLGSRDSGEVMRGGGRFQEVSVARTEEVHEYYAYGAVTDAEEDTALSVPADPMAEMVITPGNPEVLARLCETRSRWFEIASMGALFSGLFVNWYLLLLLASRIIG